jgi:RimJ/RimL family protein N-acetyltransferase
MLLHTDRLLLREFDETDWPAVLEYQSDPRYLRFNHWTDRTAEDVRAFVQMFIDYRREDPRSKFQLAIVLPNENLLIGNCGFRAQSADAVEGEIGYELHPRYWGHGYATEAAGAMLRFGFESFGARRITASVIAENTASIHVLEKLGMREERRLPNNEWMKDRWWDTLTYAISLQDWRWAKIDK